MCFNPNQEDYSHYQTHQRQASKEIKHLATTNTQLSHVALTGGEPLLHKKESIEFFSAVKESIPTAHTRLYTAGDPLTRNTAQALKRAGLEEIRFSIKIDDPQEKKQKVLERIALAREYIPHIMVEMPVLPNSLKEMQALLIKLDQLEIDGINLLEFCFPLCNVQAYKERDFQLKYPPYETYDNYWYAGGLAIAESENLCLQLLLFALENNLKLGVHYCSLENKHTGQVYQQNIGFTCDALTLRSTQDHFLKTAKVFGQAAIQQVKTTLKALKISFDENTQHHFIQFNPIHIPLLKGIVDEICMASLIVEYQPKKEADIKEVQLAITTPETFQLTSIVNDEEIQHI